LSSKQLNRIGGGGEEKGGSKNHEESCEES